MATRLPVVIAVAAAVGGGLLAGAVTDAAPRPPAVEPAVGPVASPAAGGSTWFCPGGTAVGQDGEAEQVVVVANVTDADATVTLTVMPSTGDPVVEETAVAARSRAAIEVSDLIDADWAAVLVESGSGELAVSHLLQGPTGTALAPCATSPQEVAYFPSGATDAGSRQWITVFNPFPDEAVVSVTFETEDGARSPDDLKARVVPARSVDVIDLGERVAVRREVATTVEVTSGQVIIERIQSFDGSGEHHGLLADSGARRAATTWWFPGGEIDIDRSESVVIQNPDLRQVATVEISPVVDGLAFDEQPEPFTVNVSTGRYTVVPLTQDGRVPVGSELAVAVESVGGQPVVAELLSSVLGVDRETGRSAAEGGTVGASRWILPLGTFAGTDEAVVDVVNPGPSTVRVTLRVVGGGKAGVADIDGVAAREVEVASGHRVSFDTTGGLGFHPGAFEVVASGPVVVSQRFVFSDGEIASSLAVPVAGDLSGLPEVIGGRVGG